MLVVLNRGDSSGLLFCIEKFAFFRPEDELFNANTLRHRHPSVKILYNDKT